MDIPSDEVSWPELQAEIDLLRGQLEQFRAEYPDDGDCLVAFAGIADQIRWRARRDADFEHHVSVALTDMLIEIGLVPEEQRQH